MLVEAKKRGFYAGIYRNVGDRFDCQSDGEFSKTWMIKITKASKKVKKKAAPKIPPLEIPSLIAKEEAREKKVEAKKDTK